MANTSIDLVGLDFASLKSNLKNFLKTNTQFKDVDFEGSNINVLLDLLAYNTYLNGYYTNMVASEMFLDSAQLRDSIISHAKELNYLPRSFISSRAKITVDITPSSPVSSVAVPKFTSFTTRLGSSTYTFSTDETVVLTASNNGVFSLTTDVYEGSVVSDTFVVDNANTNQRFVLSNQTVDTSQIEVLVYEDSGSSLLTYTQSYGLLGVKNSSQVFFVQAAENSQYEILFGDGVFGRRPKSGSYVVAKYRATSGELPNGATKFAVDGPIDGHANVSVSTVTTAAGGSVAETVESIKFNAPRSFQTQDRAVTASDYETLLKTRFADIQTISVFGGEEADPPQFGKVFMSVDVADADGAPETRKQAYLEYIQTKTPLTINVDFVEPEFMYTRVYSSVLYNVNNTTKTYADIKSLIQAGISGYNLNSLSDFKSTLFISELSDAINNADTSIISNDTKIKLVRRLVIPTNTRTNVVTTFDNPLQTETGVKLKTDEIHYGHTITSTTFTINNIPCILVDDSLGKLFIATEDANAVDVLKEIGTVNYETGKVNINGFAVDSYVGNYIELRATPRTQNVSSKKNTILLIDDYDVEVNVAGIKR
jgi:hypothetical protein